MVKHHNLIGLAVAAVVMAGAIIWTQVHPRNSMPVETPAQTTTKTTTPTAPVGIDKKLYSTNEADSIWVIVNKGRILQDQFKPPDLIVPNVGLRLDAANDQMHVRATTASAMEQLFKGAETAGLKLMLASGFRSQDYQKSLYQGYVNSEGQAAADRSSARPGHSEHQTGLAIDVEPTDKRCELDACFGDTPEGKWLAEHASEYGFIIRYDKDQEQLTGYEYEPWHLRYVGKNLAKELYSKHLTMEQFFGLQPSLNY